MQFVLSPYAFASLKNYYKILELPSSATPLDVKKAYRQLALKYHPDRNPGNAEAESSFKEIQEAYHVLSHPQRRSAYNQRRWYSYHTARANTTEEVLTPALIYKKALRLRQYIQTVDKAFLNRKALHQYIFSYLLGEKPVQVLRETNDIQFNRQIISEMLQAARILPYEKLQQIGERLLVLAAEDGYATAMIGTFITQHKMSGYWDKYGQLVIVLITLMVCWLIYTVSK